jgi:hypothetical protein
VEAPRVPHRNAEQVTRKPISGHHPPQLAHRTDGPICPFRGRRRVAGGRGIASRQKRKGADPSGIASISSLGLFHSTAGAAMPLAFALRPKPVAAGTHSLLISPICHSTLGTCRGAYVEASALSSRCSATEAGPPLLRAGHSFALVMRGPR